MKNKLTVTKFIPSLRLTQYLGCRMATLGAVVLICSSVSAQNLFVSGSRASIIHPERLETAFASGLTR